MHSFTSFGLRPELIKAVEDRGYCKPSPIQEKALPDALAGHDLLCQSKTGSGKTAVFILSTLNQMEFEDFIETVVLVPTRELAVQTVAEYQMLGKFLKNCRTSAFFGGLPLNVNIANIRSSAPNIVVATPGRMRVLVQERYISLRRVRHFILDECDMLLRPTSNMCCDIRYILDHCPEDRQVQMFTATITVPEAEREKRFLKLMHCPKYILVKKQCELTLSSVLQYRLTLEDECKKTRALINLLDRIEFNQVAIFVNTVERCCVLCGILEEKNFSAIAVHSNMTQEDRLENFAKFKDFRRRIVVATDLMGRGIDVEFVTFVINYDVPIDEKTYLHRIGRTGRMDRRALAVSFCVSQQDQGVLQDVQEAYGVTLVELPQNLDPEVYLDYKS
ncbi:ATP-dependent RNA helicase DDX39A [Galendromus occidentalis]|uniref:RNA helicase n=1 Tax=Galendromus occidentalis TaxID=34638 RepID=A0AAJ6VXM5_9ACAR|nr:ATP-dependent RNA helicase DDX39A [Galendromus occidentalis]